MLKAARAHGRPMIVMSISTAAISHPTDIQRPPVRNQRTFSRRRNRDIQGLLRGGRDARWRSVASDKPVHRASSTDCCLASPNRREERLLQLHRPTEHLYDALPATLSKTGNGT